MPRTLRRIIVVILIVALVAVVAIPAGIYTWNRVDDGDNVKALVQDTDDDGITDALDNCDDQKGPISNSGCPEGQTNPIDTDGDGILDSVDNCDSESGPASNNGCPTPGTPDNQLSGGSVDPCANITVPTGYHCENGNVLKDASTEITPEATAATTTLTDFCTIAGTQYPLSYGSNRIYIDNATNASLKTNGGHCEVDLGSSETFTYNSVEGSIKVDGNRAPNGNDKVATGQKFVVEYSAGNVSNGFDIKLAA